MRWISFSVPLSKFRVSAYSLPLLLAIVGWAMSDLVDKVVVALLALVGFSAVLLWEYIRHLGRAKSALAETGGYVRVVAHMLRDAEDMAILAAAAEARTRCATVAEARNKLGFMPLTVPSRIEHYIDLCSDAGIDTAPLQALAGMAARVDAFSDAINAGVFDDMQPAKLASRWNDARVAALTLAEAWLEAYRVPKELPESSVAQQRHLLARMLAHRQRAGR